MGDFLVTLPALWALRARWPEARLELAGNADAAELARTRGLLDAVHSQHAARWACLYAAEPPPPDFGAWLAEFDLIVNFWPDPDRELARRFPLRPGQQFVPGAAMPECAPASAHYAGALRSVGIDSAPRFCCLAADRIVPEPNEPRVGAASLPPASQEIWARRGVADHTAPIAIHPGSGSPRKNWPADRWLEVINQLEAPIVLVLGAAEEARWLPAGGPPALVARRIEAGTLRLAAGLTLEQLAEELRSCRLFLGHDSGVSHLAAVVGTPSVLLFGPTDPAVWAPPAGHVKILRHGPNVNEITIPEVFSAAQAG